MPPAYAAAADLAGFLPDGVDMGDTANVDRLLARASEFLDGKVLRTPFTVDADTNLPADETVADALKAAVCLQVRYWAEVGEEHHTAGMGGKQISLMGLSMQQLPPELAPEARHVLTAAGLVGPVPVGGRAPSMAGWAVAP